MFFITISFFFITIFCLFKAFEIIEGRKSLYVVKIIQFKDDVLKYYYGIDDDGLIEIDETLEKLKILLQNLSFKHEEISNAA